MEMGLMEAVSLTVHLRFVFAILLPWKIFVVQIFGTDGTTEVGTICKQFRGFLAETRTSADQFSIRCKTLQKHRKG